MQAGRTDGGFSRPAVRITRGRFSGESLVLVLAVGNSLGIQVTGAKSKSGAYGSLVIPLIAVGRPFVVALSGVSLSRTLILSFTQLPPS